uniref:NADH-ubiquinone oxidoreductase chain 3 n=1 Tax=Gmelinoides fasciatus TaxID=686704 RepID=A0A1L5BW43_9CRUS|nr:NADH dehydrogenase subunit 3 [Gmelinoides fasciatus]APL97187.1 NADH dehydrogenase subunit 3 [Gmelinoides fasciatus]
MPIILIYMLISTALTCLLTMIPLAFAKKSLTDHEKLSPFECGFDPNKSARIPFSLRFFMMSILFLIFDVELTLLLPMAITTKHSSPLTFMLSVGFLVFIITAGLLHEWNQGALAWSN